MKHKRLLVVAITLALLGALSVYALQKPQETVNNDTSPTTISIAKPGATVTPQLNAKEIIRITNDYRVSKGLDPLVENEKLNQSACAKAQHMVDYNYWGHLAPDGTEPWHFLQEAQYYYSKAGENLAYRQWDNKQIVDNWVSSKTHNENLLGEYSETGVCILSQVSYQQEKSTSLTVAHYALP